MKKNLKLLPFILTALSLMACSPSSASTASEPTGESSSPNSSEGSESGGGSGDSRPDGPGGSGGQPGGSGQPGGGGGGGSSSITYEATTEFSSDATETNGTYSSSNDDESAVLINNGASVTLINPTITKTGNTSSADNSNFYGLNASLLTMDNATAYISGGTVTSSSAEGGAGLYAYDTGVVYASGTTISTTDNCAGGIHVAGGGTFYAWDINATTQGEHSAAIRSDRGGGTMVVDGGTYSSSGAGSPAVYSTAQIAIRNATMSASGSEAASIEGRNTIYLFDCSISGNMPDNSANSDESGNTWGVILYQSGSGDSEEGTAEFAMVGGSINIKNGGFFYSTNTSSEWYFKDANFDSNGNSDVLYLFRATGSSKWGDGTGPTMSITFDGQAGEGNLLHDTASQVDFNLINQSIWTGSTEISTTYTGNKETSIYIDSSSKWVVTESCEVDNLYLAGTLVDEDGNSVSVKSGNAVVKAGTSSISVTVNDTYSASYSSSTELTEPSFPSVDKPTVLA